MLFYLHRSPACSLIRSSARSCRPLTCRYLKPRRTHPVTPILLALHVGCCRFCNLLCSCNQTREIRLSSVHSPAVVCPLAGRCLSTRRPLSVHLPAIVCPLAGRHLSTRRPSSVHLLAVLCPLAGSPLPTRWPPPAHPQAVLCPLAGRPLSTCWPSSVHSQPSSVHLLAILCPLAAVLCPLAGCPPSSRRPSSVRSPAVLCSLPGA